MIKNTIYFFPLITAFIFSPSWANELTLENAIQMALVQNKESLASNENIHSAEYEAQASYGKLLPQLSLEGKYTILNEAIDLDVNDIRKAMIASNVATLKTAGGSAAAQAGLQAALEKSLPSFNTNVQDKTFSNLSAIITQPIFTGGKILANINAKKEELTISREADKSTKNKIIVDIVTSYYRIQLLKQLVSIKLDLVKDLEEHVSHADKLLKQGMISKANKMRADVALAEAQREHMKSQKDLELSHILFANTLGSNEKNLNLVSPMFTAKPKSLDFYTQQGLQKNQNITILKSKAKQLDQKYTATRANFLPTFAAFGKYEIYKNDLTLFEPEWAVGIMMKLNIFEGGTDYNSLQSINAQKMALDYYSKNIQELVQTEIQKYYHDLNTAAEQLHSLETTRALAEENLRLNRLSFDQGVATSLEVIDAELALGKVKTEQSKALFDYDVALVSLLKASGDCSDFIPLSNEIK